MTGREQCKLLKELRKQIAVINGIEFEQAECTYSGQCLGTCMMCEAEAKMLDHEIDLIIRSGRKVKMPKTYFELMEEMDEDEVPEFGFAVSEEVTPFSKVKTAEEEPPMMMGQMIPPKWNEEDEKKRHWWNRKK